MKTKDWEQIEDLFHAAMALAAGERSDYLLQACSGNISLQKEVESLIRALESSNGLMEQPAFELGMKVLHDNQADSLVGTAVGVYKILKLLGRGGMGEVYLAKDTRLGRKVALKFLSPEFVGDNWAKRQLIKEAQAVAILDHPNICAVFEFEEIGDHSFIVMQYVEGQTLADLIRTKSVGVDQIVPLARQIVSAFADAHAHGIIHRDIKPKNIMVTPSEQVKVLDFGLAKTIPKSLEDAAESISQLSNDGLLVGTVAYMSPEQLRGEKLDFRSDIFSLGTVLYEMACGKNPYAHKTNAEVISAIMSREPQSLRQASLSCPKDLEQIVSKCLRKERAERYQSAPELLIDLDTLQKGFTLPSRVSPYFNIRFAALAAVLLLVFVVSIFVYQTWTSASHTLAVLPIVCDETTLKTQCMGPAMTEGLVRALSRRNGLRVKSSQVTPTLFGPNAASPQKAGRDLNADLVMFGKISQGEQGTIFTVRVERVTDGVRIWENSYPLNPNKVSTLQQRVSLETAVELQLPTNEDDKTLFELVAADENRNTEAYKLYLQGRKAWTLRDGENIQLAIDNFRRATEIDPTYAEAYAGVADCYVLMTTVAFGSLAGPDAIPRAEWAAREALKFGNNLAESHNAYGSVLLKGHWDWENAEKEFQKAIAINPDYQPAHLNYSNLLAITGRMEEALRQSELAVKGDPFSGPAIMNYCRTQYQARQFDQADACLDRLAADQPSLAGGKYMHGIVYVALGRFQEAIHIYEEIYAKNKAYGGAMLGYTYGLAGRRADAERILNEMQEYKKDHYLPDQELGVIYLGLNDLDHAFPLMRKSVEEKFPPAQAFFFSPGFERLRADPRFPELAKEVGLPFHPPGSSAAVPNSGK